MIETESKKESEPLQYKRKDSRKESRKESHVDIEMGRQNGEGKKRNSIPADLRGVQLSKFRAGYFFEFFGYFLLAQWLGPLSYLFFFMWKKNGKTLAQNLNIFGGWAEILRTLVWLAKVYCFVLTYVLTEYNSRSQFWLVIYTDICLAVLYGGYYSSFTDVEIKKFRDSKFDPGSDIIDRIVELVKIARVKAFDKKQIISRHPEIDVNNFFFVFSKRYAEVIPQELNPQSIDDLAYHFKKTHIKDAIIVRGENFAAYLLDKAGYLSLDNKVMFIKILSRLVVLLRVLLPVGGNLLDAFDRLDSVPDTANLILYIIQQVLYCYFIFRFAQVYDVLLIGIVLYYRKIRLLNKLKETIEVRPTSTSEELLKVLPTVPQNIENWLNLRRIISNLNSQAFVVIDTNMSFSLLYCIGFIAVYALYTVSLLQKLLSDISQFLSENSVLQTTIFYTLLMIVVVLIIHLVLGIIINANFSSERKEWILQEEIIRSLELSSGIYHDWIEKDHLDAFNFEAGDEYMERMDDIKCLLGSDFSENLKEHISNIQHAISIALAGIDFEETFKPHKLLGLKTTVSLVSIIFTFISVSCWSLYY